MCFYVHVEPHRHHLGEISHKSIHGGQPPTHTLTGALRDLRQDSDVLPGCSAGSNGVLCKHGHLVCTDQEWKTRIALHRCVHIGLILKRWGGWSPDGWWHPPSLHPWGTSEWLCLTKCVPWGHTAPLCAPPLVLEEFWSLVVQVLRVDVELQITSPTLSTGPPQTP